MPALGLDFGTTNSALARATGDGVQLARFALGEGWTDTFRSVLHFAAPSRGHGGELVAKAGPEALAAYLGSGEGRLLQSMKSYLADPAFESTSVFGRAMTLPQLLGQLLSSLRRDAEKDLGPLGRRLLVGRPVQFAHAGVKGDEALALGRLEGALATAGFDDVHFVFEPVAAAYYYERRLDHDEVILVGDFGGGTSDFTVARVGPSRRRGEPAVIASDGVGLAGDALDGRLVEHVVAPALGLGTTYRSMFGKTLDMPVWPYERLRRWHHLALLKSRSTTEMLREIERSSSDPEAIEALRELIDDDLGFALYRAVESTKVALSGSPTTRFSFELASRAIDRSVERAEFDAWITRELSSIASAIDRVMASSGLATSDIDRVFLTGGTSLVPAVRRLFVERFGADRLASGGELVSVASGLALMAHEQAG